MFTGIVSAVGRVRSVARSRGGGLDLAIGTPESVRGPALGESIAVDGACLTVVARGRGWFRVRAVPTTLERTRVAGYRPGDRVNLERAVRAGDPLGGHLVQGHVDGVARVLAVRDRAGALLVDLAVPAAVSRVSVPLGSIAVDGVSLTVNRLPRRGIIQVALIPFTRDHTTLGRLRPGDRVHVEADLIGKYLARLLARARPARRRRSARS
jgi:riboflavin synthase